MVTQPRRSRQTTTADAVVIGAGFGGLGAALTLAEAGAQVVLCETLGYPGGCASTFRRERVAFEAGATLFSGFGEGQLIRRWIDRHGIDVRWRTHDPVLALHVAGERSTIPASRRAWADSLMAADPANRDGIARYFRVQGRVADALWGVMDAPELLPPLGLRAIAGHLRRLPDHMAWMPWIGRSLRDVAEWCGAGDSRALCTWLDAVAQITVQTDAASAEAPFGLAAADFLFRGVASVHGGIGELARGLVGAVEGAGGVVRLTDRVRGLKREGSEWVVQARRGEVRAPVVLCNTLPQTVGAWLGRPVRPALGAQLEQGWGASALYLVLDDGPELAPGPEHHQIVVDPDRPLVEGNAALVSLGERQVVDGRTVRGVTVSTHVRMDSGGPMSAERAAAVDRRLRALVASTFPAWRVRRVHPASPRTFARFTGRPGGLVGGVPRAVGLRQYTDAFAGPVGPGLYLVGDSMFPGQSTLAAALGGQRTATRAMASSE
ncbi:MAG: phytoene dehydrogenase-like protein [Myxococcota bacterium]|jgi:phytoene dehydrogenase-like protein